MRSSNKRSPADAARSRSDFPWFSPAKRPADRWFDARPSGRCAAFLPAACRHPCSSSRSCTWTAPGDRKRWGRGATNRAPWRAAVHPVVAWSPGRQRWSRRFPLPWVLRAVCSSGTPAWVSGAVGEAADAASFAGAMGSAVAVADLDASACRRYSSSASLSATPGRISPSEEILRRSVNVTCGSFSGIA